MFRLNSVISGQSASQGIATDGTFFYLISNSSIKKYDASWNLLVTNNNAGTEAGVDHVADGCVYDGKLYCAAENYPAVTDMRISVWNTSDLSFVANHDISAQAVENSSLAIDVANDLIYVSSYIDETKLWKYKLSDFSYIGTITLSQVLPTIQGITYNSGYIYAHEDVGHYIYKIDTVGNVIEVVGQTAHEAEGLDYTTSYLYALAATGGANSIYIFQEVNIIAGARPMKKEKQTEGYVLSLNPVLYLPLWKRDGGKFVSDDASGQIITATNAKWGMQGRTFGGDIDGYNLNFPFTIACKNITTAVWIWLPKLPTVQSNPFVRVIGAVDDGFRLFFRKTTGVIEFKDGQTPRPVVDQTEFAIQGWTFVAASYAGIVSSIYVNGVLKSQVSRNGTDLSYTIPWEIGSTASSLEWTSGGTKIGDVVVCKRALTPPEIQKLYLLTKWRYQ